MASTYLKLKAFKILLIQSVGFCLGKFFSIFFRSDIDRIEFMSSMRQVLFDKYKSSSLRTPLLNPAAMIELEQHLDRKVNIGEVVGSPALKRNEWVANIAKGIPAGALVLDAGAGECQYKPLFAHANYKAQDFAAYEGSREGLQQEDWSYGELDYICDIKNIPVGSESFDVVLCTEVLEHLPDPINAIKELSRVLKSGGMIILSAPLGCGLHQQPHHYYGGFTPWFYKYCFEEFGIETIEITPLGGLLQHVSQECHRVGEVLQNDALPSSAECAVITPLIEDFPRILASLDAQYFIPDFTIGYVVKGVKR